MKTQKEVEDRIKKHLANIKKIETMKGLSDEKRIKAIRVVQIKIVELRWFLS